MSIFIGYKSEEKSGDLDMSGYAIVNLKDRSDDKDAVNKKYADSGAFLPIKGGIMEGIINMANHKIMNIPAPKLPAQPATKDYVDTEDLKMVKLDGSRSMTGNLNMNSNKITNVAIPTSNKDVVSKECLKTHTDSFLKLDGSTAMTSHLPMGSFKIFNLRNPTNEQDAATKKYTDDELAKKANLSLSVFNDEVEIPALKISSHFYSGSLSYFQLKISHPVTKSAGWFMGNQKQPATNADNDLYFSVIYANGSVKNVAYISDSKSLTDLNFTVQHTCVLMGSHFKTGLIVSSTGIYRNMLDGTGASQNHVTINDALPMVEISDVENDKRVFEVLSGIESERIHSHGSFHTRLEKVKGDDRVFINSLGEGGIWVCNHNGVLRNGDYITSFRGGYGQKQKTNMLRNYTVGKITSDCDFSDSKTEIEVDGIKYKTSFVGCTYHCG